MDVFLVEFGFKVHRGLIPKVLFRMSHRRSAPLSSRRKRRFSSCNCSSVCAWLGGGGTASCCFQVLSVWPLTPNSAATAPADLLPASHSSTAWRLKFRSCRFLRLEFCGWVYGSFMCVLSTSHDHPLVAHKIETRPGIDREREFEDFLRELGWHNWC